MRKILVCATATLLAASLLPSATAAAPKQQVVEGSISLPAPFAQGQFNGCFAGLHRRIATASQGQAPNGVVGYEFEIDKSTWKKNFVLDVTGGEGTVDLDIFMYMHVPPLDEWPNDPQNAGTPVSFDYTTRGEGGESGQVPENTVKAIVCMYGGPTHYGYNAAFTYTAGKGVKLPKK
jgi:hypothetical protein